MAEALLVHRECSSPEVAHLVESNVDSHPEWLPRWLPEGRGAAAQHVGIRELAPPGAYSQIPSWTSRHTWLSFIVPIAIATRRDVLRKHHCSPETLMRWARVKSAYASADGRRCIVTPRTLASVLQLDERTIQRYNACARALGLEVCVLTGRMLSMRERLHAYNMGSRQRGLASEVCFTIPSPVHTTVDRATPTRGTHFTRKTYVDPVFLPGLTAVRSEAAPRPRPPNGRAGRPRRATPGYQLAIDVIRHVPWLAQERPQRLAGALTRFATSPNPWSGADIARAIKTRDRRSGRPSITADRIVTVPAAVLAAVLRDLDPVVDQPALGDGPLVPRSAPRRHECADPDCDGNGWLRTLVTSDGYDVAVRCPRCTP